jgi:hypothetical protein
MEIWGAIGGMIVLAVLGIDQSRARRWVPVAVNRIRRAVRRNGE